MLGLLLHRQRDGQQELAEAGLCLCVGVCMQQGKFVLGFFLNDLFSLSPLVISILLLIHCISSDWWLLKDKSQVRLSKEEETLISTNEQTVEKQ